MVAPQTKLQTRQQPCRVDLAKLCFHECRFQRLRVERKDCRNEILKWRGYWSSGGRVGNYGARDDEVNLCL